MPKEELKSKRGITLVALIITIVIMLILVGVTVNVSLHGGLFKTTKQATKKYNIEVLKEEVETSYTLYNQNKNNKRIFYGRFRNRRRQNNRIQISRCSSILV